MKIRLIVIISGVLIPVLIFMFLYVNPFTTIDQKKQQLIQLALSDPRVRNTIDNKHYRVEFIESMIPNFDPSGTDTILRFYFDDGNYIQVRENDFLRKVIDVQNGTKYIL